MTWSEHPQGLRLAPGYHSVNPYYVVEGVSAFIDFLVEVFGGREDTTHREVLPDGRIDHADVIIGDSTVMMSDADALHEARPSVAFVFVPDVDGVFQRALAHGCAPRREPAKAPWGDRVGGFTDAWNNRWWVATPGGS